MIRILKIPICFICDMNNKVILLILMLLILILPFIFVKKTDGIIWIFLEKKTTMHEDLEYGKSIAEFLEDKAIDNIPSKEINDKFVNLSLYYLKQVYNQNPNSEAALPNTILDKYTKSFTLNISYNLTTKGNSTLLNLYGNTNKCLINKNYSDLNESDIYYLAENFIDNVTNCLYINLLDKKSNIVFLGTDHGLSIFTLKLAKKLEPDAKIGLFVFDEHVDIYDLEDYNNLVTKANIFGKMLLEGYVDYVTFFGASDIAKNIVETSVSENFTKRQIFNHMVVYSDEDSVGEDWNSVMSKEMKNMLERNITNVMVSIDLDVLPMDYTGFEYSILAPAIGQIMRLKKSYTDQVLGEYPEGFSVGFEPEELAVYVKSIKYHTLINGMKFGVGKTSKILGDVQELLPNQDLNNDTVNAAMVIIQSFFN